MKKITSIILAMMLLFAVGMAGTTAYAANNDVKISIGKRTSYKPIHFIHILQVTDSKPSTCQTNGYIKLQCYKCSYTSKIILKKQPHTPETDEAVPATCTESGLTAGSHCAVCGKILTEQIKTPPLGHTEVIDAAVPATCSEAGLTEGSHCATCGAVLCEQEETDMLEHQNIKEELVKATLTSDGYYKEYCADCGETLYYKENLKPEKIEFNLKRERYTGKKIYAILNVYDRKHISISNMHYSVKYTNNINVGTATATVKFHDSYDSWYSGEMQATFEIYDPNTEQQENTVLTTPAIIRAQCGSSKNSIQLYHTISKGCKTYDIQYAKNANFSGAVNKRVTTYDNGSFGNAECKVDVKSSTPKQEVTYYVRIRAVDTSSGKVTAWSAAKKVKINITGYYW